MREDVRVENPEFGSFPDMQGQNKRDLTCKKP